MDNMVLRSHTDEIYTLGANFHKQEVSPIAYFDSPVNHKYCVSTVKSMLPLSCCTSLADPATLRKFQVKKIKEEIQDFAKQIERTGDSSGGIIKRLGKIEGMVETLQFEEVSAPTAGRESLPQTSELIVAQKEEDILDVKKIPLRPEQLESKAKLNECKSFIEKQEHTFRSFQTEIQPKDETMALGELEVKESKLLFDKTLLQLLSIPPTD